MSTSIAPKRIKDISNKSDFEALALKAAEQLAVWRSRHAGLLVGLYQELHRANRPNRQAKSDVTGLSALEQGIESSAYCIDYFSPAHEILSEFIPWKASRRGGSVLEEINRIKGEEWSKGGRREGRFAVGYKRGDKYVGTFTLEELVRDFDEILSTLRGVQAKVASGELLSEEAMANSFAPEALLKERSGAEASGRKTWYRRSPKDTSKQIAEIDKAISEDGRDAAAHQTKKMQRELKQALQELETIRESDGFLAYAMRITEGKGQWSYPISKVRTQQVQSELAR